MPSEASVWYSAVVSDRLEGMSEPGLMEQVQDRLKTWEQSSSPPACGSGLYGVYDPW